MYQILDVAAYIVSRYSVENNGCMIDEMKLHKLLYFAQKESYIQTDKPLFKEKFEGWKYGPVSTDVRDAYGKNTFSKTRALNTFKVTQDFVNIMDSVFNMYASKDSWTLSRLTHSETSWKNSRKDLIDGANGSNTILDNDIILDAKIAKNHRLNLIRNKLLQGKSN